MSLIKKRQTRKSEMFSLIDEQIASGLSQIQFCKNKQISIATFSYWRQQHITQNKAKPSNHFIPIKIKDQKATNHSIEIQLPNQLILRCQKWENWPTEQLSTLITELQKIELNPKVSC